MHPTVTLGSRRQSEGVIRNAAHEHKIGKGNTLEHFTLRIMQLRLERHVRARVDPHTITVAERITRRQRDESRIATHQAHFLYRTKFV